MVLCIDPENDYEMFGNLNYKSAKTMKIEINRCKPSNTQTCKKDDEIDDFINYLNVHTFNIHNEVQLMNYDIKLPLVEQVDIRP